MKSPAQEHKGEYKYRADRSFGFNIAQSDGLEWVPVYLVLTEDEDKVIDMCRSLNAAIMRERIES